MDEISPIGLTTIIEVRGAEIGRWTLDPVAYGFSGMDAGELSGGEPAENAALIERVLAGSGPAGRRGGGAPERREAVHLRAGSPRPMELRLEIARAALKSGAGTAALARLRAAAPHG